MFPEWHLWLPGSRVAIVSMHGVAVAVAVAIGTWWAGRGAGPAMRLVALAAAVAGLVGARATFVLLAGETPRLEWSGGLASLGGVWTGLVASWLAARLLGVRPAHAFDAVVPAGLLALGIGRLGCFLAGCCYGAESSAPWAVIFPNLGPEPRHPLQLCSAAVDFMIVATVGRRDGPPGRRARHTLVAFAVARFALEALRDPATRDMFGPLTVAQTGCLALLAAAGIAALRQERRAEID